MVSPELEARRQQAGSLRAEIRPAKVAGELSQLTNCRRRSTSPSSSPGYSLSTQTSARRTASPLPPSQRTARTCSPRTCPHTTPSRRAAAPRRCAAPLRRAGAPAHAAPLTRSRRTRLSSPSCSGRSACPCSTPCKAGCAPTASPSSTRSPTRRPSRPSSRSRMRTPSRWPPACSDAFVRVWLRLRVALAPAQT